MIVKIQSSQGGTNYLPAAVMIRKLKELHPDVGIRVLIYNEDESFMYEGGINRDLVEALQCDCKLTPDCPKCRGFGIRLKAFFEAKIKPDGLEIGDEVPPQDW